MKKAIITTITLIALIIGYFNSYKTIRTKVVSVEHYFDEYNTHRFSIQTEYSSKPRNVNCYVNIGDTIVISEKTTSSYLLLIAIISNCTVLGIIFVEKINKDFP